MRRALELVALLLLGTLAVASPQPAAAPDADLVLKVGLPEEMQTRNILAADAEDVSTHDVLDPVYARPLKLHWNGSLLAYIAKGVDANGNGVFNRAEYSAWAKAEGLDPLDVLVFYDFNGVRWHDGTQVSVWDLLFSYHLNAMHPSLNTTLRVLFAAGANRSYEEGQRQINAGLAAKNWEGEDTMYGDPGLRVALRFRPTERYVLFAEKTLAPLLLPMHIWSRTGGGRHADFGCAVWIPTQEATKKGIPECGTTNATRWGEGIAAAESVIGSQPFNYSAAGAWVMTDADIIGSGPFKFDSFRTGIEAKVLRFDDFFTGVDDKGTTDTSDDIVYDARLASMLKKPKIDGIRFRVYKTTQLGVFALLNGEIDYHHLNIAPEFVPDLLGSWEIGVEENAEPGFFYLAYNMRKAPWGYVNNNPANDIGYILRRAVSHLVDRKSIVQNLLWNFGVAMHGFISPANTYWYNDDIPKPEFNVSRATAVLDSPEALAAGISSDPPGACSKDTPWGCRSLPNEGTASFEILTPQGDFGEIPPSPGSMVAQAMRDVGLNAVAKPTAFGEITNRVNNRDFDMAIIHAKIRYWDPDYLFGFFHSSGAAAGGNIVGFSNATFDALIESSRREVDRDERRQLVWRGHDVLADSRPAEPLYARMNIEGYRQDRFVNWTAVCGTIWNEWSLQSMHPPSTARLRIRLDSPSTIPSGGQEAIFVTVTDMMGWAVAGAIVALTVSHGNLRLGPEWGAEVSGHSDLNGRVVAVFAAPEVESNTPVIIHAEALHPDFSDAKPEEALLTVLPPDVHFLSITVGLPVGDILRPGGILPISLHIRDEAGAVVTDALVNVTSSDPPLLRPSRETGSSTEMAWLDVEADISIVEITPVVLAVTAEKSEYFAAQAWATVYVVPAEYWFLCPTGELVTNPADCPEPPRSDSAPVALAFGGGLAIIAAAAAFILRRHRRER